MKYEIFTMDRIPIGGHFWEPVVNYPGPMSKSKCLAFIRESFSLYFLVAMPNPPDKSETIYIGVNTDSNVRCFRLMPYIE